MALVDMFLKLDGVNGESADSAGHKDEIQLDGFSLNLALPHDALTTHGSRARHWSSLSLRGKVDVSTPLLFQKLAMAKPIPKAVLTCRKAGTAPLEYFTITLSEVLVVKVQAGELEPVQGDPVPHCDFDLAFGKIEINAKTQTSGGGSGGQVSFRDDLMANKPS